MMHGTRNHPTRMVNTEFVSRIHQIFENTSPFSQMFQTKEMVIPDRAGVVPSTSRVTATAGRGRYFGYPPWEKENHLQ